MWREFWDGSHGSPELRVRSEDLLHPDVSENYNDIALNLDLRKVILFLKCGEW